MKKPLVTDKLQLIARTHYNFHDQKGESRGFGELAHMSMQAHCLAPDINRPEKSDDDNSDPEDFIDKYSEEYEHFSTNLGKLFPPPNPLPPQALMYLKEPLRLGANIPLM